MLRTHKVSKKDIRDNVEILMDYLQYQLKPQTKIKAYDIALVLSKLRYIESFQFRDALEKLNFGHD